MKDEKIKPDKFNVFISKNENKYFLNQNNLSIEISEEELQDLDSQIDKILEETFFSWEDWNRMYLDIERIIKSILEIKDWDYDELYNLLKMRDSENFCTQLIYLAVLIKIADDDLFTKKIMKLSSKFLYFSLSNRPKMKMYDCWKYCKKFEYDKRIYDLNKGKDEIR